MKETVAEQTTKLSVVIPTLGGEALVATIEQMNRGSLVPTEILICIPKEDAYKVENLLYPNVSVIKTNCRGQVAQRSVGFQEAKYHMVLQLDDDIYLPEQTLKILVDALKTLGQGNVIAPVFFNVETSRCCHEISNGFKGWVKSCYYYFFCSAPWGRKRMGVITEAGLSFGVDNRYCGSEPFETQWLLGGCTLCFKEDLVIDCFFPYTGKAYSEDLIHSYLRTQKGLRHWVIPTTKCYIDTPISETHPVSISAQNRARRYFVELSGGSLIRLTLYEKFSKALQTLANRLNSIAKRSKQI